MRARNPWTALALAGIGIILGVLPVRPPTSSASDRPAGAPADPRSAGVPASQAAPGDAGAPADPRTVGGPASQTAPGRAARKAERQDGPPASSDPADSVRFAVPVEVEGGRVLSTRHVRSVLRASPSGAIRRREIREELARLGRELIAAGYFDAQLHLTIDSDSKPVLRVDEGPEARWDTLVVHVGSGADTAGVSRPGHLLKPQRSSTSLNAPRGSFDSGRFEDLLWSWVDLWTENGHPFAVARVESIRVEGGRVEAGLHFDPGPRLSVAADDFPGKAATRSSFLNRWIRFVPGELYRESDWQAKRRRLEQSGLFERVGDPTLETLPEPGKMQVLLPVQEGKHNRLEGALGYSGETRTVSGFADLDLGDLFGTGRHLDLHWERLARNQSVTRVQYQEPLIGPLPVGATVSVEQEIRDSTFTVTTWQGLADAWVATDLTAFAGAEYRTSVIGQVPAELTRRLSSVIGGTWETLRPGLYRGGSLTGSFRSGQSRVRPQGGGATQQFRLDRAELQGERFWSFGRLLTRGGFEAAAISRGDSLAAPEVIRIGGAGTVRGYEEQEFSTTRYGAAQLELGVPVSEGRVYVFSDGAVFRRFTAPGGNANIWGAGVGLSSETANRRITVDLGFPRGGTLGEGRVHLRVETRF